jgi:uncharacterized repeat protein (TIGR01451 family)
VVTVNPIPVCTIDGPAVLCVGETATYTATPTDGCEYTWSLSGDCSLVSGGGTADNFVEIQATSGSSDTCDISLSVTCNGCPGDQPCTKRVSIVEASQEVSAAGDTVCVGLTAEAVFTIENTSDGPEGFEILCSIDGSPQTPVNITDVPKGETRTHKVQAFCEAADTMVVSCIVTATVSGVEGCSSDPDTVEAVLICLEPDVEIAKSTSPVVTQNNSRVTIVVTNTGNTALDPVRVTDQWPAGLTFDETSLSSGCGVTASTEEISGETWITFSDFTLAHAAACTIGFNVDCATFDNEARIDTARVIAWCDGVDSENPENLQFAVTDEDTSQVTCQGGEACPRTIGFWRQQSRQRDNGSTKICLAGMKSLWRCVISTTNVVQWTGDDLLFGLSLTDDVEALPDEADPGAKGQLFEWMEAQLKGPRPMTLRDMAEVQYLGLMLNVCSGALPTSTALTESGGFTGTVAEAIAGIENALNGGGDIGYWKDVADSINNRVGITADDCPEGVDFFRNLDPCLAGFGAEVPIIGAEVTLRAFPNPVSGSGTMIQFNVPAEHAERCVEITLFDVAGRLVRRLLSEPRSAGLQTVNWDLRDGAGSRVTSGIYFSRLRVGDEQRTIRLLVLPGR